jgi:F-type H+-transporting ATPase subunit a
VTPQLFGDPVVTLAGSIPVTETMLASAAVTVSLLTVGAALAHAARARPFSRLSSLARVGHRAIESLVTETAGAYDPAIARVATALFAFIATSAVVGQLPGVRAPTANLAATSALALVVFVSVPVVGILRSGARAYFREYFRPNPLFFPMHIISEISRTLALALRLFGNMMSGHLVVALLVALAGLLVPVPLMALDLLIGLLQAYIFTILACVYLGAAKRTGESK